MGCCISKCSPDQDPLHHLNHVQEKLVISRPSPPPVPQYFNKISPSPTSSTCSVSSFSCTSTSSTILTSASSLSTASSSSALTSKDRSFSNDFLWSCYRDNPHIIRINSLKEASLSLVPTKPHFNTCPAKSSLTPPPKLAGSSAPHKRLRSSSPANLTRQKSMRKEAERPNSAHSRTLRSPSPSRRFDGGIGNNNGLSNRMMISPKPHCEAQAYSVSSLMRKENMKASSPNRSSRGLRHRSENCSYSRVGSNSKIEETVVKEVECQHDMRMGMLEDVHNPLISLDCFIFL